MLNALRALRNRYLSTNARPSADQTRQTGQKARDDRASTVNSLREDITRLQHEIADLNDAMTGGAGDKSPEVNTARMASLHHELARKQHELGKYQARI